MPIYEFVCDDCKQQYEEHKKTGDYDSNCPLCSKKARKIISRTNFSIVNSSNKSIDSAIGEMAEKRWSEIEDNKKKRIKENFGQVDDKDAKTKDGKRIAKLLNRQNKAYDVIENAKKEAGITKNDELKHAIGGSNAKNSDIKNSQ